MQAYQQLEQTIQHAWCPDHEVVACSSGTAALHLALEALQLPQGSEVIVPDLAMVALPRAVVLAGHKPVFVDVDAQGMLDADQVDNLCGHAKPGHQRGGNVRALIAMHLYGRCCAMDELSELANKYDLYVIEDMAELHNQQPHQDSDAACWSFYRNKVVAGEEGGAVAFADSAAAALARQLRSLGFTDRHDFWHIPRGHNYRMSNAHATLILDSFANLHDNLFQRRLRESVYDKLCPAAWRLPPRVSPWVYDLRIPNTDGLIQNSVVGALQAAGITARHCFKPCRLQREWFNDLQCGRVGGWNSDVLSREVIYLPLSNDVTAEQIQFSFDIIHNVLKPLISA